MVADAADQRNGRDLALRRRGLSGGVVGVTASLDAPAGIAL